MYDHMLENITASATMANLSVKVTPEVGEGFGMLGFPVREKQERLKMVSHFEMQN